MRSRSTEVETFHLPLTWSSYWFRSYLDCQLKQGKYLKQKTKQKKVLFDVNMSTMERVPQGFSAFFYRSLTSPQLNVNHSTKTTIL